MSQPLTPPPLSDYGAFTVPRILQRWLDVNPITALTRTQAYITLPSFSQTVTWQGYSDIVVAFNYEGPNNFTLTGFNVELYPTPNYCLCVAWRDENGNMNRYSLWRGVGEVIYGSVTPYAGQKIAKNFRFEIWSTNSTPAVQVNPINIYTSVLGGIDYRYGADFQLVGNDTPVTSFGESSNYNPTALPTTNLWNRWIGNSGVSGTSWISSGGLRSVMNGGNTGNITTTVDSSIHNATVITNPNTLLYSNGSSMSAITVLYALVKPISFTNGNYWFAFTNAQSNFGNSAFCPILSSGTGGNITLDGNLIGTMTAGSWYVLCAIMDFTNNVVGGYVIPVSGNMVEPAFSLVSDGNAAQSKSITVGENTLFATTESFYLGELDIYNVSASSSLRSQIISYFQNTYGTASFAVPLTFPTNSSPTVNNI